MTFSVIIRSRHKLRVNNTSFGWDSNMGRNTSIFLLRTQSDIIEISLIKRLVLDIPYKLPAATEPMRWAENISRDNFIYPVFLLSMFLYTKYSHNSVLWKGQISNKISARSGNLFSNSDYVHMKLVRVDNGIIKLQIALDFTRCWTEILKMCEAVTNWSDLKTISKHLEMKTELLAVSCEHKSSTSSSRFSAQPLLLYKF